MTFKDIFDAANTYSGLASVVLALIPLAWATFGWISIKKQENAARQFETYHRLINDIVDNGGTNGVPKVDRQIAAIFELRKFRPYFPISFRILTALKATWTLPSSAIHNRLTHEIQLTLDYIEDRKRLWVNLQK
ncbi:hypothetical protein ACEN9F_09785 [Duganella sp. CT11-25]|uniref:hypothetical protein n=1 Tax=unclassified Duganella TaxID=2636909 RepID=UPI0039AF4397